MQKSYSNENLRAVWAKGQTVAENDPDKFRKDQCGAWMDWDKYGNRDSKLGWEVDHMTPMADGGSDSLSNLRPLQWENNASKSDERLVCVVKASGNQNVNI